MAPKKAAAAAAAAASSSSSSSSSSIAVKMINPSDVDFQSSLKRSTMIRLANMICTTYCHDDYKMQVLVELAKWEKESLTEVYSFGCNLLSNTSKKKGVIAVLMPNVDPNVLCIESDHPPVTFAVPASISYITSDDRVLMYASEHEEGVPHVCNIYSNGNKFTKKEMSDFETSLKDVASFGRSGASKFKLPGVTTRVMEEMLAWLLDDVNCKVDDAVEDDTIPVIHFHRENVDVRMHFTESDVVTPAQFNYTMCVEAGSVEAGAEMSDK